MTWAWLAASHMHVLSADANFSELASLDTRGEAVHHWDSEWGVHPVEWHSVQL